MPLEGTVVQFFPQEGKRFGFIQGDDGNKYFFHYDVGCTVIVQGEKPHFNPTPGVDAKGAKITLPTPRIGDRIIFHVTDGHPKKQAKPWSFLRHWEQIQEYIAHRPIYRAYEQMNSLNGPKGEPKVLWEGQDIGNLPRQYKLPVPYRASADPLLPYWGDSDNIFEVLHWWEMKEGDGDWWKCDDPRPHFR